MATERPTSPWLVSPAWLAERLGKPDVTVVDGSFYLSTMNRDAAAEYLAGHIPGAVRFDVDAVADHSTDLPHMLPGPDQFGREVGALGIGSDDTIIVYDGAGMFSSARVWWTFRLFGATKVYILEGGLPAWRAAGGAVEPGPVTRAPRKFDALMNTSVVANIADVQMALNNGKTQVVDVRPANRFRGEAPEPRPGVRSGHMPGSLNVPFTALIENGKLVSPEKIKQALAAGGVDPDKPIITSCGSGVSAATLWLALDAIGKPPAALYDGSWAEWGSRPDMPIAPKR